jgi:hypothetical protein
MMAMTNLRRERVLDAKEARASFLSRRCRTGAEEDKRDDERRKLQVIM